MAQKWGNTEIKSVDKADAQGVSNIPDVSATNGKFVKVQLEDGTVFTTDTGRLDATRHGVSFTFSNLKFETSFDKKRKAGF